MLRRLQWGETTPEEIVGAATDALGQDRIVVFPSGTTYVAAGLATPTMAERLKAFCRLTAENAAYDLQFAVQSVHEIDDWLPAMSLVGQRLMTRCWPGPVTLICSYEGLLANTQIGRSLTAETVRAIWPNGKVALGCPRHESIYFAVARSASPVLFAPLYTENGSPIVDESNLDSSLQADCSLVIADGATDYRALSSVVELEEREWKVVRAAAVSAEDLKRLASCYIVLVCTGNTCRSPMAEAIGKKLLADQIGCTPSQLPLHGYVVVSAGVAAANGMVASPEAALAASEFGADLSEHRSQLVSEAMLSSADHIYAMTASHLERLRSFGLPMRTTPQLLAPDGTDIDDPIGAEQEVYRACAEQIRTHLQSRLSQFQAI